MMGTSKGDTSAPIPPHGTTQQDASMDDKHETDHAEPYPLPPRPGKRKYSKTSEVWNHFTKIQGDPKFSRAKCNYCTVTYACHGKAHGTSNMLNHNMKCEKNPNRIQVEDPKQLVLTFATQGKNGGKEGVPNLVATVYDPQDARKMLARMIIVDELPFRFVENDGFRGYTNVVQPKFVVPSRHTIAKDCTQLYHDEKKFLKSYLKIATQHVCLTTDAWTSVQSLNYMVLTAHFVNSDWNLEKKVLNFSQIPNHKGDTIGKAVEKCLLEWGIEKVFTVTVDNANSNDGAISYLSKKIKNWNGLVLEGRCLHVRCCAHILNLIVCDALKDLHDSIFKIRSAIKYVRSSPSRLLQFKRCVEEENLSSKRLVCLDVPTRWNSTYLMLESALIFQKAFDRLEEQDAQYTLELMEDKKKGPPVYEDWENTKVFVKFLKVFYDVTLRISGSLFVTSNGFLREMVLIQDVSQKYSMSRDPFLSRMALNMKAKYDKYWGNTTRTNYLLYVAIVLDPRYKLKFVEYCLHSLYGNEIGSELTHMVDETLRMLYSEYKCNSSDPCVSNVQTHPLSDMEVESNDIFSRYEVHKKSIDRMVSRTELGRYLLESCEEKSDAFDVLAWWKVNSSKFKVLGSIARDVLAIPISTVASESTFSTSGRVLDSYRSRINF